MYTISRWGESGAPKECEEAIFRDMMVLEDEISEEEKDLLEVGKLLSRTNRHSEDSSEARSSKTETGRLAGVNRKGVWVIPDLWCSGNR